MPNKLDPKVAEDVMLRAGFKPLEPYKGAHSPWVCKCIKCGKITKPTFSNVRNGSDCAYCSGVRIDSPDALAIMQKANLKPLEPYIRSNLKWRCKCLVCKRIVQPTFSSIRQGQGGCEYCAGNKIDQDEAIKIMLKAKLQPLEPFKSSKSKWKCRCMRCDSIVSPHFEYIKQGQGGCIPCGYNLRKDPNKILLKDARAILISNEIRPIGKYINSTIPWKSRCLRCQNIIYPRVSKVKVGERCAYCAGVKVTNKHAKDQMVKAKLQPLEPYVSAKTKWKCRCQKCKRIVYPTYGHISQGVGGCRYCRKFGIDMLKPSYIYLIRNDELGSYKIGIGNVQDDKRKDRLAGSKGFLRFGWKTHKVWRLETGEQATKIETSVFKVIRSELLLPIHLSKSDTPISGGHSETVSADSVSILKLEKIISNAIKELQK
jgi:hypothetical protein